MFSLLSLIIWTLWKPATLLWQAKQAGRHPERQSLGGACLSGPAREPAVLTLDGVQMRIKPQLASVSLLCGLFGKHTKRGWIAWPTRYVSSEGGRSNKWPRWLNFHVLFVLTRCYIELFSYLQSSLCCKATVGYSQGQTGWRGGVYGWWRPPLSRQLSPRPPSPHKALHMVPHTGSGGWWVGRWRRRVRGGGCCHSSWWVTQFGRLQQEQEKHHEVCHLLVINSNNRRTNSVVCWVEALWKISTVKMIYHVCGLYLLDTTCCRTCLKKKNLFCFLSINCHLISKPVKLVLLKSRSNSATMDTVRFILKELEVFFH